MTEPFNGPAILSGRASAVFFHEVLGHRLEGQRQRGDEEGQTFTKLLGQADSADIPQRLRRPDAVGRSTEHHSAGTIATTMKDSRHAVWISSTMAFSIPS